MIGIGKTLVMMVGAMMSSVSKAEHLYGGLHHAQSQFKSETKRSRKKQKQNIYIVCVNKWQFGVCVCVFVKGRRE